MQNHPTVPAEQWLKARQVLLAEEKELTRVRDRIARLRRELPRVRVDKEYVFDGPDGRESLFDLFAGNSQLVVYHFMFDPDWEEGCKSCSFLADHYDPAIVHLRQRDVTMVTVSRAPLAKLQAFRKRMGWNFKWMSSLDNDFNRDYHVSFTPAELEKGEVYYNYAMNRFPATEAPGLSVFSGDPDGAVYHHYSSYGRGLDMLIGAYNLLDLVPRGRAEEGFSYTMEWLRLHDQYDG